MRGTGFPVHGPFQLGDEGARVRAFVPIMVERTVRRELKEQAPHNNR